MTPGILSKAFNQGSDARLAGRPITACPYPTSVLKYHWRAGWLDVDKWWPKDRLPEIPVNPLKHFLKGV